MPIGWHISIFRQENRRGVAAEFDSPLGSPLAVWQTGWGGLDWVRELVRQGKAIDLGGNGYPLKFTALAEHLLPFVHGTPPEAKKHWSFDSGDVLLPNWLGETTKYPDTIAACSPSEWLVLEAWDES